MENNEAVKHDEGKPRYDLIPPFALDLVAQVMTYGATKYGERNWEKGLKPERLFAALMRHSWAWMRGETIDPETNLPHLAHAAASVMMLIDTLHKERQLGMTYKEFLDKLGPEIPNEDLAKYLSVSTKLLDVPLETLNPTREGRQQAQEQIVDMNTTQQMPVDVLKGYNFDRPEPNPDLMPPIIASTPLKKRGPL